MKALLLLLLALPLQAQTVVPTQGDIGANINAAFRASAPTATASHPLSSAIILIPPGTYTYTTPIEIPSNQRPPYISAPVLDCQGASLIFAGSGDAIIVHGENALGPGTTGAIRNCTLQSATPHSRTVSSLIHIRGRLGFTLDTVSLTNAASCIDWESTNTDGGPGYSEEDTFQNIATNGCASHLLMNSGPGSTGSFEYNFLNNWHFQLGNLYGPENGVNFPAGTRPSDAQGTVFNLRANTYGDKSPSAPPVALISLSGGTALFRGAVNLSGENTGSLAHAYSVFVASNSVFYEAGNDIVSGMSPATDASTYARYVLHPALQPASTDRYTSYAVHFEPEQAAGAARGRTCKFDTVPEGQYLWLANYGGNEVDCVFSVVTRVTDAASSDVYRQGSSSHPVTSVLQADGKSGSVGIGPGFSPTALPRFTLDVHGPASVSALTLGNIAIIQSATAPVPNSPCTTLAWILSNDGHITFCNGHQNIPKI